MLEEYEMVSQRVVENIIFNTDIFKVNKDGKKLYTYQANLHAKAMNIFITYYNIDMISFRKEVTDFESFLEYIRNLKDVEEYVIRYYIILYGNSITKEDFNITDMQLRLLYTDRSIFERIPNILKFTSNETKEQESV
jgi:transcription elongation factor GreA-like protein